MADRGGREESQHAEFSLSPGEIEHPRGEGSQGVGFVSVRDRAKNIEVSLLRRGGSHGQLMGIKVPESKQPKYLKSYSASRLMSPKFRARYTSARPSRVYSIDPPENDAGVSSTTGGHTSQEDAPVSRKPRQICSPSPIARRTALGERRHTPREVAEKIKAAQRARARARTRSADMSTQRSDAVDMPLARRSARDNAGVVSNSASTSLSPSPGSKTRSGGQLAPPNPNFLAPNREELTTRNDTGSPTRQTDNRSLLGVSPTGECAPKTAPVSPQHKPTQPKRSPGALNITVTPEQPASSRSRRRFPRRSLSASVHAGTVELTRGLTEPPAEMSTMCVPPIPLVSKRKRAPRSVHGLPSNVRTRRHHSHTRCPTAQSSPAAFPRPRNYAGRTLSPVMGPSTNGTPGDTHVQQRSHRRSVSCEPEPGARHASIRRGASARRALPKKSVTEAYRRHALASEKSLPRQTLGVPRKSPESTKRPQRRLTLSPALEHAQPIVSNARSRPTARSPSWSTASAPCRPGHGTKGGRRSHTPAPFAAVKSKSSSRRRIVHQKSKSDGSPHVLSLNGHVIQRQSSEQVMTPKRSNKVTRMYKYSSQTEQRRRSKPRDANQLRRSNGIRSLSVLHPETSRDDAGEKREKTSRLHRMFRRSSVRPREASQSVKEVDSSLKRRKDRKTAIPPLLVVLRQWLKSSGGLTEMGVFRIEPSTVDRNRVEKGLKACDLESGDPSERDVVLSSVPPRAAVHVASSLIRRWFRELPQSIFAGVDMSLLDAARESGMVPDAITGFKEPNRTLLLWVVDLCATVALNKEANRMDANNLSKVFAPSLYHVSADKVPLQTQMEHVNQIVAPFLAVAISLAVRVKQVKGLDTHGTPVAGRASVAPVQHEGLAGASALLKGTARAKSHPRNAKDQVTDAAGTGPNSSSPTCADQSSASRSTGRKSKKQKSVERRSCTSVTKLERAESTNPARSAPGPVRFKRLNIEEARGLKREDSMSALEFFEYVIKKSNSDSNLDCL